MQPSQTTIFLSAEGVSDAAKGEAEAAEEDSQFVKISFIDIFKRMLDHTVYIHSITIVLGNC